MLMRLAGVMKELKNVCMLSVLLGTWQLDQTVKRSFRGHQMRKYSEGGFKTTLHYDDTLVEV